MGDEHEKKRILQKLAEQRERVLAATSAPGLGIDAPSIRVVIHLVPRSKLRDHGQESGRAGRDGEKADTIVIHSNRLGNGNNEDPEILITHTYQNLLIDSVRGICARTGSRS